MSDLDPLVSYWRDPGGWRLGVVVRRNGGRATVLDAGDLKTKRVALADLEPPLAPCDPGRLARRLKRLAREYRAQGLRDANADVRAAVLLLAAATE